MINRFLLTVACAALLSGPVAAQTIEDDFNVDGDVDSDGGGETTELSTFESLSPGNQKIAQSLFDAQGQTTDGDAIEGSLSLDDIAAMKQEGTGWGRLFQDLQAEGYIDSDAKNLGQLVSGKYQPEPVDPMDGGDTTTTDGGDMTTTDGEVVTAGTDDGMTTTDGEPSPNEGAFDDLSTGNQKIARALFDSQGQTTEGEAVEGSLTLDDIAAMKQDGSGWGQTFREMQGEGYIDSDAKNLGQLVSGRYEAPVVEPPDGGDTETTALDDGTVTDTTTTQTATAAGKSGNTKVADLGNSSKSRGTTVVTTANGQQITVGRGSKGKSGLDTSFDLDKATGKGSQKVAVTTAGGGAGSTANHGQGKKVGVTTAGGDFTGGGGASHGGGRQVSVTTAGGASVTAGGAALGHTNAGGGGHGNGGGGGKALGKSK